MAIIQVLDHATIDKIAAGEVVERPASIAKELVENAIDAGAKAITVEIKEGGISFLRVTDNGGGIPKDQVEIAFLRHATSKIRQESDLDFIETLGFRGEALASIAAVSMVEMVTKVADDLTGTRYVIEGGVPAEKEEIGAPDGTTIIVRNVFYNVPARKKFLKKPMTEGAYISDMMEHMAMSHAEISFRFIVNNQVKFSTPGNGNLKEVIYRIYGKEFSDNMKDIRFSVPSLGMDVTGYIGTPGLNRSNRNHQLFYINQRFIRSNLFSKALEEGYRNYMMQHRFPVCVLHIFFTPGQVDVNVHPTKMEVRISNGEAVYSAFAAQIAGCLSEREMIPKVTLTEEKSKEPASVPKSMLPEIFELQRMGQQKESEFIKNPERSQANSPKKVSGKISEINPVKKSENIPEKTTEKNPVNIPEKISEICQDKKFSGLGEFSYSFEEEEKHPPGVAEEIPESYAVVEEASEKSTSEQNRRDDAPKAEPAIPPAEEMIKEVEQISFLEDKIVSQAARQQYHIVGQIFKTYWLVTYREELLIIDQHAAHEKVKYERFMKQYLAGEVPSQMIAPPVVISLSGSEAEIYKSYADYFEQLGFALEDFGGNEYAIRGIPMELFGNRPEELFLDILEELRHDRPGQKPEAVLNRIATMACKAAVKGNQVITLQEMEVLLDELMMLENPYHCPHGRPTIITMSKSELEKKFKRIV